MAADPIKPFTDALNNSKDRLNDLSEKGRKIIGYFCTYTPVEVVHAAGFIPVRVTGGPGVVEKAYSQIPDFICPYMKRCLEKTLSGQYGYLSGLIQGYTCDAACGLVNIWKDAVQGEIFHLLPLPYNNTDESRKYFKAGIREMIEKLNAMGGSFSQSAIDQSLALYARIRSLLLDLYTRRYKRRLPVSARELMTVMKAGAVIPPENYLKMLETLHEHLSEDTRPDKPGCPVLISGSLIESGDVLDRIEAAGGNIVADDLCNGLRQLDPPDGEGKTSMDRLIQRYMNRSPCPSRSRAITRVDRIADLMTRGGAKGAVFILQKFCTPHLADFPIVSEELKKRGYPSILVEMDESWQMEGQLKTRLEGFFEMLMD